MILFSFKTIVLGYVGIGFLSYLLLTILPKLAVLRRKWKKYEKVNKQHNSGRFGGLKSVLIVTAHPDDECMFFGPTIQGIHSQNPDAKIHLLCLSHGRDYPKKRAVELEKSCRVLNVTNVNVLENKSLQDDPKQLWPSALIAKVIVDEISTNMDEAPQMIITFDELGISGHTNHISVYTGCKYLFGLIKNNNLERLSLIKPVTSDLFKNTGLYVLKTTNLIRKYSIVSDTFSTYSDHLRINNNSYQKKGLPTNGLSIFTLGDNNTDSILFINDVYQYSVNVTAMKQHKSQLLWFRYLFMIFSRYFWENQLVKIN